LSIRNTDINFILKEKLLVKFVLKLKNENMELKKEVNMLKE
jgi:hypothetical protein